MPHRIAIRRALPLLRALGLVVLAACCPDGRADESAVPQVRESAPEIYYMQDDAGRLVPVPGFRYRDFVDLLRIREGLPGLPEAPAAVLENIAVRAVLSGEPAPDGQAAAGRSTALCRVQVELSIRQARAGWVSLPIGFEGLLLIAAPTYEGPGRMLFTTAGGVDPPTAAGPQLAGYRLWLSTPNGGTDPDIRHVVHLEGSVAVEGSATHESIALDMPRATASSLEIRTPRDQPAVSVRPQWLPPRVEAADGGGARVTLVGLSGPVRVRLGDHGGDEGVPAAGESVVASAVPQSVVETIVRIDGRVAVTEAALRLENLPAGTDTIRVSVPPRSTLQSVRAPASLVRVEGAETQPVAVIRVDRAADGRCAVDLKTERPVDPTGREPFEPLGFAVAGIPLWRQWGRTSIVVDGDWQVEWDDAGGNRRIDPPPAARGPGFVAAFAFDAQPASLPLRIRPRGSRLVIEPEYRYDVAASRVSLDARLRVSVRGAPASRIVVLLADWDIDEVGPSSIVDAAAISTEGGRLVIPFVQPLSGDAVVEIRGGLPLEPGSDRVAWRIPVPQADLVGPASIVIGSQSDIEVLPDADAIQGLVRHVAPTTLRTDVDRTTLAYRLDGPEGGFAATRRFLPRRVDATISTQADIDESDTLVRETLRFDVAHVPMEFVTLDVPESVARTGTLEVRQNGQLLNPVAEPADDRETDGIAAGDTQAGGSTQADEQEPRVRVRAMLAVPLLGAGDVTLQYEVPTPTVPPETTVAEDLPLVVPAGTRVGRQSITLAVAEALSVDVRGNTWKRDVAAPGAAAGAGRVWTTARLQTSVPLAVSARQRSTLGETEVEAAWLQTLLIGGRRQDVYAYAVTSTADRLSLTLPSELVAAGEEGNEIEVRLDGRRQASAVRSDGQIVIELSQRSDGGARLLEIRSVRRRQGAEAIFGTSARMPFVVDLESPAFMAGTAQRRFYWEVLLEPDDHAIRRSGEWTSLQRWERGNLALHRVPAVSRAALASWLAAAVGGVAPDAPRLQGDFAVAGSRAVFSGVGPPGAARIWVVPTWLLVLAVSGPVLAIGLLAVYQPWMRRVPVVLVCAAAATLAAAVFSDLAPLAAQAAIPGVVLTALAGGLRARLRRGGAEPASPSLVVSASSLTQAAPQPSLIIGHSLARTDRDATALGRNPP